RSWQLSQEYVQCLSTNKLQGEDYRILSEAVSRGGRLGEGSSDARRKEREAFVRLKREDWKGVPLEEYHLLNLLDEHLCDTCKTFGSPFLAGVAHFHDLVVREPWGETVQIRDGVGIDR